MTTIDNFDISDKIVEFLTINHDKLFTIKQIHSEFYEKYEEFKKLDLKKDLINKLKVSFMTIEGEYNNIYRIVNNDKHYLIWSLRKKDEIINDLNKSNYSDISKQYDVEIEKELDNFLHFSNQTDYLKLINQLISENNYSFMFENNYIDGVNHPIHLLIINNEFETIKKLGDLTTIDFNIKNKNGKSCTDLAKEAKNFDILEYIILDISFKRILNIQKLNDSLKENQKQNYQKIDELNKKIAELTKIQKDLEDKKDNSESSFTFLLSSIILYAAYSIYKYSLSL